MIQKILGETKMKEITFNTIFTSFIKIRQLSLMDVREVEEFEALHLEKAHTTYHLVN